MLNCWQVEVSDRPTFAELHTSLDILLTSAQSENYIDLNVDEMLPYYQVSSVQGDEEEMEEKDTHPSNGYHYTTGLNHGYLQGNRRPRLNSSESSILSCKVNMQDVEESEHTTVPIEGCKQEEEQSPTDTDTHPDKMKQTSVSIPQDHSTLTFSVPEECSEC